jgi:TPR repeat protein
MLVGVNDYKTLHPLKYACNDVNYLAEQLKKAGYEEDNVVVVCDTIGKTSLTPLKENIERELNRLINKIGQNDQFFFVFCGHGLNIGNQAYLAPYDMKIPQSPDDTDALATLIPVDWVYEKLAACSAKVKLLFLDACQEDLFASRAIRETSSIKQLDADEFQRRKNVPNLVQIQACSPGEFSYESSDLSHGVFSYFLAEGLSGKADLDKDGRIDIKELDKFACDNTFRYVRNTLKKTNAQTPRFFGDLRANPRIAELAEDMKLQEQLTEDLKSLVTTRNIQGSSDKYLSAHASLKIAHWKEGAEKGIAKGECLYGLCLSNGIAVDKSAVKAVELFQKAADHGLAAAQYYLGNCYLNGEGVTKDYEAAAQWFRKAADQDDASAQVSLGVCYQNGTGVVKSLEEAIKLFSKAAEQGNMMAQNNLGTCYKNMGNYEEAIKRFRHAAEQDNAYAQYNLGICYENGFGVAKDTEKALTWYHKAAAQGLADAQYNLGVCYQNGNGVAKDSETAVKWYRKAAAQGYIAAIDNLNNLEKEIERIESDRLKKEQMEQEKIKKDEQERLRKEITENILKDLDKKTDSSSSQSSNNDTELNNNYPSTGWTDMGRINGVQVYRDNRAKKEWTVTLGQVRSADWGSSARGRVAALGFRLPSFSELQQMESHGGKRYLNISNGYYETSDSNVLGNPALTGFRTPQQRKGAGQNYYIGVRQSN